MSLFWDLINFDPRERFKSTPKTYSKAKSISWNDHGKIIVNAQDCADIEKEYINEITKLKSALTTIHKIVQFQSSTLDVKITNECEKALPELKQ